MNSKPPTPDNGDDVTALVCKSRDQLAFRASLIGRGLHAILDRQRGDSLRAAQDQGMQLLTQEKFDEAIAVCSAALERDPLDESLWQIKGVCLAQKGNIEQAFECLDYALKSNSANPYCWLLKSRLFMRLSRTEERLECLRHVVRIDSHFKGAWKEIGVCLLELGKYEEAARAFDSELKLNPLDLDCRSKKEIVNAEISRRRSKSPTKIDLRDWSPSLVLNLGHWWTEPYYNFPLYTEARCFSFLCDIENISGQEQLLGKQMTILQRSKETGEMFWVADALILESPPEITLPLRIAPNCELNPVIVEVVWICPDANSEADCVQELLDDAQETLGHDDEFGTVIRLVQGG